MRRVSVSFTGTIPTQAYGSVKVQASWDADLDDDESPAEATQELFSRIRDEITVAVTPIAEAKLRAARAMYDATMTPQEWEKFQANFGVITWLQSVVPESAFADTNGNGSEALQEVAENANQGPDHTERERAAESDTGTA